jgi:hypothetical protein
MSRSGIARPGLIVVLFAMAIAVFVAAGCSGESPATSGEPRSEEAPGGAAYGDSTGNGDASGAPATSGSDGLPLPQLADRKIVRTATLELEVEDVAAAVQEVEGVAVAASGFVSESNVFVDAPPGPDGDGDGTQKRTQTASVTIRVPAEAYSSVMSKLRGIAKEVRSERSEASEVTEEYTDLEARLRNLEATEASYLELLAKAGEISDILLVQDRLNGVRLEIEQVQGRINVLDSLVDLATITVQLSVAAPGEEPGGEKGWVEKAWDAAWDGSQAVLVALGTVAIVGGVALVWLIVPGIVGLLAWRRFGSRLVRPRPPPGSGESGTPE